MKAASPLSLSQEKAGSPDSIRLPDDDGHQIKSNQIKSNQINRQTFPLAHSA
jgi:hypothetical protein